MPSRLTIAVPGDYVLARDACSYGYFLLAPNHWDPAAQTFSRVLGLESGPAVVVLSQPISRRSGGGDKRLSSRGRQGSDRLPIALFRGVPLRATFDRTLTRAEQGQARGQITRMLRLDESEAEIRAFHRVDPRWRRLGRGRFMRSPTLFEDVLKTVTSCNVQWPGTVTMNARLCEVCGKGGAFPSAGRLARTRPGTLRGRCRVGYRDTRIVALAKLFSSGRVDPAWFEDPSTPGDEIHAALLDLPGIGPYAAANIMQLLGRYDRLPLDTESLRHGRSVLGFAGPDRRVMKAVADHFAPFGRHAFRSYWLELWAHYEGKQGPSWTWCRETTATAFTASRL